MAENVRYKQAQIINFFASKDSGNQITRMKLYKLIWLSDKLHLLQHGDFFSGDDYCIMKFGVVPSGINDLTKTNDICGVLSVEGHVLTSKVNFDKSVFSETELDVMDKVWTKFGGCSAFFLSDLSHVYPEYLRHKSKVESKGGSHWVEIEDFFKVPAKTNQSMSDFFDFEEEYLQFMLEEYLERKKITNALEEHHAYTDKKYLQSMN